MNDKIKIALVRGNSLNEWEGKPWEKLEDFAVTGFCSKKNLYNFNLSYPVNKLACSTDNFFVNNFSKYLFGKFQTMYGLEKALVDFDIAHTVEIYYSFTNQAVRAKKNNSKLKVACTVWDNSFGRFEYNYWPGFKEVPKYWRKMMNQVIKENAAGVDVFLPVSNYSAQMLVSLGVNENKIKVLTPGFINKPTSPVNVFAELGITGKEVYLMVNRMVKEKGIYDVLYAWKTYLSEFDKHNKVLLVIGDGPETKNFLRLVNDLGLDIFVSHISKLPNDAVKQLYAQAKCLILASIPTPIWQEQFGYVLVEAISNGCPVVSTYNGAIPEIIENAGLLFPSANPAELKKCLQSLDNEEIYKKLQSNCLEVKNKFAINTFISELSEIYKNLI